MSSSSVWRPDCRLIPSRHERRWRLALILLCAAAVPASHAPWPWLLAATLLQGVLAWRLWHSPSSCQRLHGFRETPLGWRLTLPGGEQTFADVHGPVRDWSGLLCLCFRERREDVPAGQRPRSWHLVLWADQLPAQDWRRLRVSLRWRRRDGEGRAPLVRKRSGSAPTDRQPASAHCPRSPD